MSTIVIKAPKGLDRLRLKELWEYRELLFFIVWRDVKVRYKQTIFGAAWAVLQPLLLMVVFSIFLGRLAKVPSDGMPYPIFAYSALVPWTLFAQSLTGAGGSLVSSSNLISKVFFPRLVLPVGAVGSYLVDFFVAFLLLLGMMLFYGVKPTANIVWLPLLLVLAVVTALAVGIWLAALNVRYRDVQYVMPFLVQLWLFSTPVAYSSTLVPAGLRTLFGLNPMAGVVEGFRWALLGTAKAPGPMILLSALVALAVLVAGTLYFQRVERTFADFV